MTPSLLLRILLTTISLLFGVSLPISRTARAASPNVLVILADDCTFSDLSIYGGLNSKTPNIELLASQGLTFNRANVSSAMCQPFRAELFTGQLPLRNGCASNHSASLPEAPPYPVRSITDGEYRYIHNLTPESLYVKKHLSTAVGQAASPNVVFIVADDMGYADLGTQGAKGFQTPHLDRLAAEGTRFTDFYVAQSVCTASRAALMTGCYPNRLGMQGAFNHTSLDGIGDDEWLLSEMFKEQGYATAGIGKWHLGTRMKFHPLRHGFDEWFGIPYSNDNTKYHPTLAAEMPPLPLYDGEKVIELDPDQSLFTRRFTQRAINFIERNASRPFFLYLPHVMPHVPIFASDKFKGRSQAGLYGDVLEELDWSVGEVLATLRRLNLEDNTLVIFISDNGPFLSYGEHAGSAEPLREGKLTTFEGGVRVPCLVRWTGRVPAGQVCAEPFMGIDWLPTLTQIIGGKASTLPIDGRSAQGLILGESDARPPHEALFFYSGTALQAVRSGSWKLHFPHPYITPAGELGRGGKPSNHGKLVPASIKLSGVEGIATRHGYRIEQLELSLFDLNADPGETKNVAAQHPDVVKRLTSLTESVRRDLGDSLTNTPGTGFRCPGVDTP